MEDSHKVLESRLSEVTAQLDSLKIQLNQMSQERDMVTKSLEVARAEKYALDKNRVELNAMGIESSCGRRPVQSTQRRNTRNSRGPQQDLPVKGIAGTAEIGTREYAHANGQKSRMFLKNLKPRNLFKSKDRPDNAKIDNFKRVRFSGISLASANWRVYLWDCRTVVMSYRYNLLQESLKGEITKLKSDLDNTEKRAQETKASLLSQSGSMEGEFKQTISNLKKKNEETISKLNEERARLGGSEGRVRALETTLQQLEIAKREVEQKLSSVGSTLRRIAGKLVQHNTPWQLKSFLSVHVVLEYLPGIQMDGSVNLPYKLLSPTRRWSPVRMPQDHSDCGRESTRDVILDVDPDAVRKGVRTLMQQVAQKLQERLESESATVAELEERCGSLKSTVEQLNQTLERASITERELNKEMSSLQRTLTEASATSQSNADKLKSLQKAVYNAENEKRVAIERLEAAQQNLAEVRRSYTVLKEAHSRLQGDLSANEVEKSALEAQLRMANWPNDNEELKRQANELNMKIEALQDKVNYLFQDYNQDGCI
ncbi:unnamed protein product [Nesidiocoris tenuis]|uniref:Uncharacterized protein n=1 Tax=Nesidiocoris tenuis TaxID=355587 RepID=A0A6H5HGV0_9HEMI|nr:unnamed protein product [Nesidiocoris tenuis]CAB0015649.1 unnamed protein product [Nesidiocoris tenuis]